MSWFRTALLMNGLLLGFSSNSQFLPLPEYPKGYFRNPLDLPISLSGNFGELRNNHYHMGLDFRTQLRENYPVYAAADGYVARIKIEPGGFGKAIYIAHPKGFTTLYAHLKAFNPVLERWVKEQQYRLKSWKVDLEPGPGRFPVKKGDLIARSGNSGASEAPHLHFEIRNTADERNLNPLFFGFPLADHIPPQILRLAIYDRTRSTYEQQPRLIPVFSSTQGRFMPRNALIIVDAPKISLAITAFDKHDGSSNLNGIAAARLFVDERPVIGFLMDRISYAGTRYLNAHIDYRTRVTGGPWLQHLSELPGYPHSIYQKPGGNGVVDLSDGKVHELKIRVQDAHFNSSSVVTRVQWSGKTTGARACAPNKMFFPNKPDGYEAEDCTFYIGENCLYDSVRVCYQYSGLPPAGSVSGVHNIGSRDIPLQEPFLIRIKPSRNLSAFEKKRVLMQMQSGSRKEVQKVDWQQEWAAARFRDFGAFRLLIDTIPPTILPLGFTHGANLARASHIAFTVSDNEEKLKNVNAELDGKWLCFSNDKGRQFIYIFDAHCPKGPHQLRITAEDEAGNLAEKIIPFTR